MVGTLIESVLLLSFIVYNILSFTSGILQTPSPRFDEHITLREKNNRYVHLQLKLSEDGGVNKFGVKTKF